MNKRKLAHLIVCMGIAGLAGCANTEPDFRRPQGEEYLINGTGYASAEQNDKIVGGVEGPGAAHNPDANKPNKKDLGSDSQYEGLEFTLNPPEASAYINETIEYTIKVSAEKENTPKKQFVITLEKGQGANGALIAVEDYLTSKSEFPPTDRKLVLTPISSEIKFRVQTGSFYNNSDPMYYVYAWHANYEDGNKPKESRIFVQRPASVNDDGIIKGSKDVENDLSIIGADTDTFKSTLSNAQMINLDNLEQQLYADSTKLLKVQVKGQVCTEADSNGKQTCEDSNKSEPICWTFVRRMDKKSGYEEDINTGYAQSYWQGEYKDGKEVEKNVEDTSGKADMGIIHGCSETGADGTFGVRVNTFSSYNSRYYLNFFHPTAGHVTYTIDTFALPTTTGDHGDHATITEDELKIDTSTSEKNEDNGQIEIVGCNAAKIIDQFIKDEAVLDEIGKQCGGVEHISACEADGGCGKDSFTCKLVQNSTSGWTLKTCSDTAVTADVNGDKKPDPVTLIVVTDEKDGSTYYNGMDIDGDGIPDVAPDPCIYLVCTNDPDYDFLCSTDKDKAEDSFKKCSKLSFDMDKTENIHVMLKPRGSAKGANKEVNAKIIRSALATNNAMFDKKGGAEEKTITTDSKGIGTLKFWTGTAYDSLYFIQVQNNKAKTVLIPVAVNGGASIPASQGDKPDDSVLKPGGSAVTPPPGAEDGYDINLGNNVEIVLPDGMSDTISAPIIKTRLLQVKVQRKDDKSAIKNTKTYWKVTRGASASNNALLTTPANVTTDDKGIATGAFYTGTGYDSLYYVSVFHPNVKDSGGKLEPIIFKITTTNDTGSVSGPDPSSDPTLPEGGSECSGEDCNTVNGQPTNDSYPQKSCGDLNTCEDKNVCSAENDLPECCGGTTVSESGKQGCLELILTKDSHQTAETGSIFNAEVRLVWRNGSEMTPVRDKVIWTLDKGDGADGELMSDKTMTNKNGYASVLFKTGSKATTYRINAMYPNIHKDGNMVPKTIFLNVQSKADKKDQGESVNTITLTANTNNVKQSITSVNYFVLSSYNYSCDDNAFLFSTVEKAKQECGKRTKNLENPTICDVSSTEAPNYKAESTDITNANDRLVVYAVASNGSSIVGYGCSDMNVFGSPYTADCDKEDKSQCPKARDMAVTVRLDDVPLVLKEQYQTQTLVDIGPLLKTGSDTSVYKAIDDIFAFIKKYSNIGDMIYEKIESIVFMNKEDTGENCFQAIRTVFKNTCEGNLNNCCEYHSTEPAKCSKSQYTGCGCVCGDFYYYMNTKLGSLLAPALKSGLKSLLKKYLSAESLQNTVCDAIDDLQFITLEGKINLTPKDAVYTGQATYSTLQIPYLKEKIDLAGDAVTGKWREARLENEQLSFKDYSLKLTYGTYIYQVLGKMVGLLDENTGEIKFTLNCEKIFANGILGIGASGLQALCKVAVARINTEATKFAVSKYADLNLTLQGSAEIFRGNGCVSETGTVGCIAQTIEKGTWSGSGSLGEDRVDGKSEGKTIQGVWVGRYDQSVGWPDMTFGGQTIEEFKAANSVCRKKMKEQATSSGDVLNSNKACLLGSYGTAGSRSGSNACEKENCSKGGAIVVCADGKFNMAYSNSSAADIIRAANQKCKAEPNANGCEGNPEIINGGAGITNEECLEKCSEDYCKNNTSIFVCNEGKAFETDELNTICNDNAISAYGKECIAKQVKVLCEGKNDDPGCVMNKDNELIYNSSDTGITDPAEPVAAEEVIHTIVFSLDDAKTGTIYEKDNFKVEFQCAAAQSDPQLKAKKVAGPDGSLNAVGTRAVDGDNNACYFEITGTATKFVKVEFKLNPAERLVKYELNDHGAMSYYGNNEWSTIKLDNGFKQDPKNLKLKIWPSVKGVDYNKYNMMRLADVKIYGIK